MKRLLAVLLTLIMIVSMTACGGGSGGGDGGSAGKETLEATLWTLNYDPDVWSYQEDDFSDGESYSSIIMIIPGEEEDSYDVNAEISVSVEDPYTFRDYLTNYGFDQYEYAENNAYEFTKIGGVDCLTNEGEYWGDPALRYFARIENAGATVFIEILGEYEDERVAELLSGLTIKAEDTGNVDGPWSWEGEPFSAEPGSSMVGTYTVNSEWIPFNESVITGETFEHDVAVVGDKAYILSEGKLKQYAFDGSALTYEQDIAFENEFSAVDAASDGSIWLSNFMEPLINWKDGAQTASYEGPDNVAMHPSGTWGISWFSGPECEKITLSGGSLSSSPMNFAEVSTIMHLMVDENYIYVCGTDVNDENHKVFVYNHDGALQKTLTDADGSGLGSITFMAETGNGFIGLDGNMREIVLWSKDGNYIGTADDGDMFGTNYPWFCSATKLDDGSILAIMTEDRADESAMELIAFKLSGF